ncbi:putative ATP-dependent RNA helicase TDRD12 [Watersipora subatra]|uniref:putative ATP-dependent RNA helicase TDRD12 n=1 Tax=Watersipora subatra TaxID=2589382 RepID=UPI00355B8FAA
MCIDYLVIKSIEFLLNEFVDLLVNKSIDDVNNSIDDVNKSIDDVSKSIDVVNKSIDDVRKFTVKGRGQALLDSIEETSTSPRRDSFSPPGMMRLPKSHSAGSDSSNSYQRARRPKLSNMKSSASHGDTALLIKSPNSSHAAAQRSSPSLLLNRTEPASSDFHTVYNSSPYPQIESSPYPQVESSPYPQVSSPYSQGSSPCRQMGSPYSQGSSPYRQVGSPYSQGSSPYRQVESFSGLDFEAGDSSLNAADSQRVYEKQLISPQTASDADVSRISAISYDESRARAMKKQVTVFSDVPITPVFGITYSKLHERALRHWRSLGGSDKKPPHILQAYAWPALRRGMELIAISDPFYMEGRDGVSLSYLMAIATLLFDLDSYMCLPKGNGPRCLILCASWKKAEQIHFHVTSLFGDKPEKSLLVLHGRRETEHKLYCQLINGADVIVSTPCTFIRMLEAGHVNVIRLCHLVIDDADIIAKEFPQELSRIMKRLGEAVSQNPDRAAPRQIALFSSSWTKRLAVFRTEYMTAPVTLFTNKIEAAIACNVKQMVHFIEHENQRLGVMIKLVKESGTPSIKLVVCTHSDGDASKVYKALKAYSYDVYVAMKSLHDLDQTLQQWEEVRSANSYPILVITDEVLNLLISDDNAVVDAKYVLHYNMPASKRLLGMRLHCLSSHYAANSEDIMLASHIIFSPRDHKTATTLVRILERTGGRIPAQLAQLSIDSIERNESGKKKELCDYMKSYGVCRDQLKCNSRHLVSAQLDTPSAHLPTSGDVEFKVVSVKDAATCYARLIRHRDINGVQRDIESKKFALDLSLQTYYTQPHVCIPIDPATVEEGRLCVYEKDKIYYRAQILSNNTDANIQHTPEISIRLLDEGLVLKISINQLFELPPESNLELHPPEIVEVKICKLKPMDHDIDWSVEANAYMSQLLQGEILSGKIQLCIGNTLWCDPIVKRQYLTEFSLWVSLWYASLRLIGNVNSGHLATRNLEHLQLLRRACEGKIQLPALPSSKRTMKSSELLLEETETEVVLSLPTRQLDEGSASHVYLSEVDNPDRIFVILTDEHER